MVIDTINFLKIFAKFHYWHPELIVIYNIFLKTLLHQGISKKNLVPADKAANNVVVV